MSVDHSLVIEPKHEPNPFSDWVTASASFLLVCTVGATLAMLVFGYRQYPVIYADHGIAMWLAVVPLTIVLWLVGVGWYGAVRGAHTLVLVGVGVLTQSGFVMGLFLAATNLYWLTQLSILSAVTLLLIGVLTVLFPRLPRSYDRPWITGGIATLAAFIIVEAGVYPALGLFVGDMPTWVTILVALVVWGLNTFFVLAQDDNYQTLVTASVHERDRVISDTVFVTLLPFSFVTAGFSDPWD